MGSGVRPAGGSLLELFSGHGWLWGVKNWEMLVPCPMWVCPWHRSHAVPQGTADLQGSVLGCLSRPRPSLACSSPPSTAFLSPCLPLPPRAAHPAAGPLPGEPSCQPPCCRPFKASGAKGDPGGTAGAAAQGQPCPYRKFFPDLTQPEGTSAGPRWLRCCLIPSPAPLGLPWAFPFSRSLLSTRIPSCRAARTRPSGVPKMPTLGSPRCPLLRSPCRRAGTAPERAVPPDRGSFPPHCSAPRPDQGTSRSPSPWPAGHSVTSPGRCHPALPLAGRGRWELRAASPCGTRRGARGPWRAEARSCRPSLGVQSISRRCEAGSRGPARGTAEFLLAPSTFRGCSTHRAPAAGTPSSVPSRGG
eukprot:XP_027299937.1 vegetative cell wall protein gp1-like [Anas platyrhynchos]